MSPTITLELPVAGTDIEAGLHATNYGDLQTLLNGGLDENNLAAGAVTAAKLTLPYIAYTPVWTSTGTQPALGDAVVAGRYVRIGKFVHCTGKITFGATSTYGTGSYFFSLPVNRSASSIVNPNGIVDGRDASTGARMLAIAETSSGASAFEVVYAATYLGAGAALGQTAPWTWASGDHIAWNLIYESV